MTDAHRFAPAAPDESIVHGACAPGWDASAGDTVAAWLDDLTAAGIERVCCLLSDRQVDRYEDLLGQYRERFGPDRVLHAPITDHTLADPAILREDVLPFLRASDEYGEPVVVHCLAGIGRTGQALAAWLVHARGYEPDAAVETVSETGRDPAEAVRSGNATRADLDDLLRAVR